MDTAFSEEFVNHGVGINLCMGGYLPRDAQQTRLLHEPEWLTTNIDPLTGRDIHSLIDRPRLVDRNVTIYFESEETRQAYLDFPALRSVPLADNPYDDGEAEG